MNVECVCPANHKHAASGTCYVIHKCRCQDCRDSQAARSRQRSRLKAYGRYDTGLVDAAPAREHLLALRKFGMGYATVARHAGISKTVTRTLLYGREDYRDGVTGPRHGEVKKRISCANSAAILSVSPDPRLLGTRITIDGKETARRLQALVALGWSQSKLARFLRMEPTNMSSVIRGRRVRAATSVKVEELYDRISNTLPPLLTGNDKRAFVMARRMATENGWPLPMDWEAYDNDFTRNIRRSA